MLATGRARMFKQSLRRSGLWRWGLGARVQEEPAHPTHMGGELAGLGASLGQQQGLSLRVTSSSLRCVLDARRSTMDAGRGATEGLYATARGANERPKERCGGLVSSPPAGGGEWARRTTFLRGWAMALLGQHEQGASAATATNGAREDSMSANGGASGASGADRDAKQQRRVARQAVGGGCCIEGCMETVALSSWLRWLTIRRRRRRRQQRCRGLTIQIAAAGAHMRRRRRGRSRGIVASMTTLGWRWGPSGCWEKAHYRERSIPLLQLTTTTTAAAVSASAVATIRSAVARMVHGSVHGREAARVLLWAPLVVCSCSWSSPAPQYSLGDPSGADA
ncbi:hypothetical protein CC78DRAFT_606222 [Lojkania enalia]|uniref:Uncharacterized protein n=1 Tax=Lojkania enalia TaxID=147567 RepID=A0A9P4MYC9_9PLEO|nr:hypothetical protein CC78DRAFT_606222 [Didymosphaeria enalia]